ncbi:MAG: hypothetical protein ACRDQ9_20300 [Pseudonocardiaceae bacterium]
MASNTLDAATAVGIEPGAALLMRPGHAHRRALGRRPDRLTGHAAHRHPQATGSWISEQY